MARLHRLMPNTEFARAFVVQRIIGEGAMGTVYLATRKGDGREVAVKVLKPSIADDDRATARFGREAIVAERIGNPHVVDVLDAGFDEDTGLHWLSMEYLDGEPLPSFLERGPTQEVRHRLLRHLFDAIAAAHRAGVLHRDLKPENVVVTTDDAGQPLLKVLDFGVAKMFAPQMAASATDGGLGTPLWTAPEQGRGGQNMRPSVDVWALGLLTFFILTGKIYWRHANNEHSSMLDLAQEMLQAPIADPSTRSHELDVEGWSSTLDPFFMQCVNRTPADRFEDADHARAALFPLLGFPAPTPASSAGSSMPAGESPPAEMSSSPMAAPSFPAAQSSTPSAALSDPAHASSRAAQPQGGQPTLAPPPPAAATRWVPVAVALAVAVLAALGIGAWWWL